MLVQKRRNTKAALKLMKCLLKSYGIHPESIITDGLGSYGASARDLNLTASHQPSRMHENNRTENSHLSIRRREREQRQFKS